MAVAARPEEDVLAGLEAASQGRLLIDAGDVYQFAHDVVREVVEGDIGSARRATLHRRAAIAIEELRREQLPDQYEALAEHYVHGEVWDKALQYTGLSGDKAVSSGAIQISSAGSCELQNPPSWPPGENPPAGGLGSWAMNSFVAE